MRRFYSKNWWGGYGNLVWVILYVQVLCAPTFHDSDHEIFLTYG